MVRVEARVGDQILRGKDGENWRELGMRYQQDKIVKVVVRVGNKIMREKDGESWGESWKKDKKRVKNFDAESWSESCG